MHVTAKVPPIQLVLDQIKQKITLQIQEASLFAVQGVVEPIRQDLQEEYANLPAKHREAQQRHKRKPVFRKDGSSRKHVYDDIIAKADHYRNIFGAWAVIGAESRQPHLHLIELGTTERWTSKAHGEKYRGRMPTFRVVRKVRDNRETFVIDKLKNGFIGKWNSVNQS